MSCFRTRRPTQSGLCRDRETVAWMHLCPGTHRYIFAIFLPYLPSLVITLQLLLFENIFAQDNSQQTNIAPDNGTESQFKITFAVAHGLSQLTKA
jgi:hypothetical protein